MPIQTPCQACDGTGLINGETCALCAGTGFVTAVGLFQKMHGRLPVAEKLVYTHKIVAVIDATEYIALVDAAKDGLRMIMSCGVIELDHAGKIYADLMAIFGSSPITKAAIEAL